MAKRIAADVKAKIVSLAGACFWYWNSFYSFLESCDVPADLYSRYPKEAFSKYDVMRNVLGDLEEKCQEAAINSIISNFYRMNSAVDSDQLDDAKAKRLLDDFRVSVGSDPVEAEIRRREAKKAREKYTRRIDQTVSQSHLLKELNDSFQNLASTDSTTPQQRGFELEKLFFQLLEFSEIEHCSPYRTKDGEQIDGHFRYEKFDYLVEAKWTRGPTKQPDLSIFDGKIRGKAQSTRGLFLSAEGFDSKAVNKFSGDSPRIVLMTGEDLAVILAGGTTFFDLMRLKIDGIVRHGRILTRMGDHV